MTSLRPVTSPSPDALRLSRLDRLIDQLGEQHLTIRQQGVSVIDLAERLQALESTVQAEKQALWPLKEVDVRAELRSAHTSLDRLAKQVAMLSREQEDAKVQQAGQLLSLEQRQAAAEARYETLAAALEQRLAAVAQEQETALGAMREFFSTTLSQARGWAVPACGTTGSDLVISSVADQFDAVQQALDEAISGRAERQHEQSEAAKLVQESLAAQREWVEQQAGSLQAASQRQGDDLADLAGQLAEQAQQLAALEHSAAEHDSGERAQQLARWREDVDARLARCLEGLPAAEVAAEQAAAALSGAGEAAARVDSLCERLERCERDWQGHVQATREEAHTLGRRVDACEQSVAEHSAQGSMATAWDALRAELQASLAQHAEQHGARLAALSEELAEQRGSCEAATQHAGALAEDAQRSCRAAERSMTVLAAAVDQVQSAAEQAQSMAQAALQQAGELQQQQQGQAPAGSGAQQQGGEQHEKALEQWRREWQRQVGELDKRLKGLEAAGESASGAAREAKEAALEWRRSSRQQLEELSGQVAALQQGCTGSQQQLAAKMDEYRAYVKRLRKEVQLLGHNQECGTAGLSALRHEFAAAQDRMERLHLEAMDLAGELERTVGAATGLHTTLQGGWAQRGGGAGAKGGQSAQSGSWVASEPTAGRQSPTVAAAGAPAVSQVSCASSGKAGGGRTASGACSSRLQSSEGRAAGLTAGVVRNDSALDEVA
ncbi:hypothetical protein N2152v2_004849 [Parachlorella kessleri]